MAVVIEANYSKKIGLPSYSSHSYSLTVRTELSDMSQIEQENAKLYALLQDSVDREIQEAGFIPTENGSTSNQSNPVREHRNGNPSQDEWKCSEKQQQLILKIVKDHHLDKKEVEQLALDRFQTSVRSLNRMQASGLIKELLERDGKKNGQGRNGGGR